jgi:oxygen-independent coproporphyrinogen-3 oxidase
MGLGPAAHSGASNERRWNVREWAAYQRLMQAGKSPLEGRELLDNAAVALEQIYLGLRTAEGLALDQVPASRAQEWEQAGWAVQGAGRLRLTPEGWLRLDALVPAIAA